MVQQAPRIPRRIGGYRVQTRLGAGGMGEVYRAVSRAGEQVAIKVIRGDLLGLETRLRFGREVKAVSGPRVACLIDANPEADEPWLATQYIHGPNLLQYVEEHGPLPPDMVAILGAMLAEGLRSIEQVGMLHRDLKPQNIVLGPDGPVVIDFGLAVMAERKQRLTATGIPVGTAACMPPEQALGEKELTTAADVYGLGATLLYAVTGRYPYAATGFAAMIHRITDPARGPDLEEVPEALRPPLEDMLRHDADARPGLGSITDRLVTWIEQRGLSATGARELLVELTTTGVEPLPDPIADTVSALFPDPVPEWSPQAAGETELVAGPGSRATVNLVQPIVPAAATNVGGPRGDAEAVAPGMGGTVPPDRHAAGLVADRLGAAYAREAPPPRPSPTWW